MFEIFVLLSVFLRYVIADSNSHPDLQTRSDSSSSLDFHPDLGSRNRFTEPAPLLPTNGDYALLLSEQASSPFPLGNGDNTGSLISAESGGCSSAATQLSNKMRRAKRDKGICDAVQDTKKSDPIIQPGQEQGGEQENDGRTTPSSKNLPTPMPFPQLLKSDHRYHSRSSLPHFILTWDMNVKGPDILDQGVLANRHGISLFEESLICRIRFNM